MCIYVYIYIHHHCNQVILLTLLTIDTFACRNPCLWGWAMGSLYWVQTMMHALAPALHLCIPGQMAASSRVAGPSYNGTQLHMGRGLGDHCACRCCRTWWCRHTAHYKNIITMTSWWARWRLKSPASRLFTQPFIRAQIKANIKARRHWPLCGEFTGDQ